MVRGIMTAAVLSGIALGTWASFFLHIPRTQHLAPDEARITLTKAEAPAEPVQAPAPDSPQPRLMNISSGENPAPDREISTPSETLEAIGCGLWSISEACIEAILVEMIRRGWTPPTRAAAAATDRAKSPPIQADSPGEPGALIIAPESEDLHKPLVAD
jgi:hypothetical protein